MWQWICNTSAAAGISLIRHHRVLSRLIEMSEVSPSESAEPATGRTTLLIVFVVVFIDLLGFGIVLPLLPRYSLYFRASHATIGLLMASFSAMQFLFAPMWGSLSDRIGRRPVLLIGLAGSTLSYFVFGYATTLERNDLLLGLSPLTWLFISRIGAGIAGATIATAQAVIADNTGEKGRGKGMALIGAAFGIGFTFGPLIGAASTSDAPSLALTDSHIAAIQAWPDSADPGTVDMVQEEVGPLSDADVAGLERYLSTPRTQTDLRDALLERPAATPGFIAAALSALALLFAFVKLRETRPPSGHAAPRRGWLQGRRLAEHLKSRQFSTILIAIFITTFAFAQFESTLALLTREFGYGDTSNFIFFAYIGFVLMIGQGVLVRRLLPRIGEHRMAIAGVLLMVGGFVMAAATGSRMLPAATLWLVLPVITIGFSALTPSLQSLLSQAASADEQGVVLGTGQSLSSLARIIGPYTGLQLLGISAATPYWLAAGLMLLGGIQILRMQPSQTTEEVDG